MRAPLAWLGLCLCPLPPGSPRVEEEEEGRLAERTESRQEGWAAAHVCKLLERELRKLLERCNVCYLTERCSLPDVSFWNAPAVTAVQRQTPLVRRRGLFARAQTCGHLEPYLSLTGVAQTLDSLKPCCVLCAERIMFELLSLFPSAEAIKRGDKDYHAAVNIANVMHNRVAHWEQGGW